MLSSLLIALPLVVAGVQAETAPGFEQTLGLFNRQFVAARAEQRRSRALSTAAEIDSVFRSVSRLRGDASRLNGVVSNLGLRAQRYAFPLPGFPETDPFLRSDLQRATHDIRDLSRYTNDSLRRVRQILGSVQRDTALVYPAQNLLGGAQSLNAEANSLSSQGRWARSSISGAGFTSEAWDIERGSQDAAESARQLQSAAAQLLGRVL